MQDLIKKFITKNIFDAKWSEIIVAKRIKKEFFSA